MVEHDPAGVTANNINYTYNYSTTQPHTLTSVTSPTALMGSYYTYNPTGTTATRNPPGYAANQTLEWTPEHKLASNTVGSNKTTYVYDADGNRILENSPTGSTLYLGETELTTDSVGLIKRASRTYAQAGTPAVVRTTTNQSTTGHTLDVLLTDHLGTAHTTVEAGGTQPVTRRAFKPYGEARGTKPTDWPNKRSYLGVGIDDKATLLTHIGAREYDQNTGRFLSADPIIDITDPLQMNGYTYANGSPVSKSDPTGLIPMASGGNARDEDNYHRTNGTSMTLTPGGKFAVGEYVGYVPGASVNDTMYLKYGAGSDPLPTPTKGLEKYLKSYHKSLNQINFRVDNEFINGSSWKINAHFEACNKSGVECSDDLKAERFVAQLQEFGLDGQGGNWRGSSKKVKKATTCPHSFLPDTKVLMADGSHREIKDVKVGDIIIATDPGSGKNYKKRVAEVIRTEDDKSFTTITISADGKLSEIVATGTHPFWVPNLREWVDACNLTAGQLLRTSAGASVQIAKVTHYTKRQRTYDLSIDDIHTYYVLAGATPVLVHNCGGALLNRARELYATRAHEASTVAVARVRNVNTGQSETWVATERTGLPDEWRGGNAPLRGERYIPGQGHAEATIMNRLGSDWEITGMASSTRMCPACFAQATGPGVGLTPSPIGKGTGVSSTGNTPWRVVLGGGG